MGKGDKRRPRFVDRKTFEENWEETFKRRGGGSVDFFERRYPKTPAQHPVPLQVIKGGRS